MLVHRMSPEGRSRIMRSIRKKNTKPELDVRRLLHRLGFRFRVHRADLPGNPDIVLPKHRAVIFVHGCFWHQHPRCHKGMAPRLRRDYWLPKLARTVERDRQARSDLAASGYRVLVLWECEIGDANRLRDTLWTFLSDGQSAGAVASERSVPLARSRMRGVLAP
jgi:DNA mismatch endonuclease, patch repair protein